MSASDLDDFLDDATTARKVLRQAIADHPRIVDQLSHCEHSITALLRKLVDVDGVPPPMIAMILVSAGASMFQSMGSDPEEIIAMVRRALAGDLEFVGDLIVQATIKDN